MNYQSRPELLSLIFSILPEFEAEWAADNEIQDSVPGTLHSVYMSFLQFVSVTNPTKQQLNKLAILINGAVEAGGDSENAVSTCFLEHAGQVGISPTLRPLLARESRSRLHA